MIAKVYPIKRMPRRFSVFDYDVPEGLSIHRGSCVRISFRSQSLYGIVAAVEQKGYDRRSLKPIESVCQEIGFSDREVSFFELTACDLAQSVPSLLFAAIPTPKKTYETVSEDASPAAITGISEPGVERSFSVLIHKKTSFLTSPHLRHTAGVIAAYLQQKPSERVLIVAPNVRDANSVYSCLPKNEVSLMSGEESPGRRSLAWQAFKRGQTRVLLGTRLVSLLPDERLDAIFVVRSSHDNLKQNDRNPRYDARRNVIRLAEIAGSRLYFIDVAPRVDDFDAFSPDGVILPFQPYPMRIIDIASERAASPHWHISYTLASLIDETLKSKRRVVLSCNKRGIARSLRCRNCRHEFLCKRCAFPLAVYPTTLHCHHCGETQPLALSCPSCGGTELGEVGSGNLSLRRFFAKTYPGASIGLVEKNRIENPDASIVIATSHYFEMVEDPLKIDASVGLVAEIDADASFIEPTFRSAERAIVHIERLRGFAERHGAAFAIQTYAPHIFAAYDRSARSFFLSELDVRRAYSYPPFSTIAKLTCKNSDPRASAIAVETLQNALTASFPEAVFQDEAARLSSTSRSFFVIVPNSRRGDLLQSLAKVNDNVIIDTDATL